MRNSFIIAILGIFILSACSHSRHPRSLWYDPNDPGYEYAPAMYHSWPYEPLTQVTDEDATSWHYNSSPHNDYKGARKMNVITPVEGTIARGKLDYYDEYENSDAGRTLAGQELSNPLELNNQNLREGRRLFNLYCDHCHGEKGDGNGPLVEAGKFPTMGAYYDKLKDRKEGEIYHTITYGKGIMGAHASQLSPKQRWLIITWVTNLQRNADAYKVNDVSYLAPAIEENNEQGTNSGETIVEDANSSGAGMEDMPVAPNGEHNNDPSGDIH